MPTSPARRRIAYLSYSNGVFDARTQRMARSAVDAGFDVVVYARWEAGLPLHEELDGYRLVRVASNWMMGVPGLRARGRRAAEERVRRDERKRRLAAAPSGPRIVEPRSAGAAAPRRSAEVEPPSRPPSPDPGTRIAAGVVRRLRRTARWRPRLPQPKQLLMFPVRPLGWATAVETVAGPADLWHGMWAGSLPALGRLRRRHGGRTIYDSRDVFMHSRGFEHLDPLRRWVLATLERRWARQANTVITVNEAYADILQRTLGIERPAIVMNCPVRWEPPTPRPNRVREALSLPLETKVVLYQGNLITDRGIEQSMDAILDVPGAVLALMGYGAQRERYEGAASRPPYEGRVFVLPPVPPSELLDWTASADVLVAAIQPTSLNHTYTTPQKLFEAIAAGVPVVGANLPGIAEVIESTGTGVLCDPTSPVSIAKAIRDVLEAPEAERVAMAARARTAADERYNWEAQVETLLEVYERLAPVSAPPVARA